MTTENIALFKGLGSKIDFLNQRQRILSQNIANSDTPNYRPQDLVPVNFDRVLKDVTNSGKVPQVHMEVTDSGHNRGVGDVENPKSKKQKETYEVAPAGNAVVVEEQMFKANKTMADYNLMTNLFQKHVSLIRTSIGTGQ